MSGLEIDRQEYEMTGIRRHSSNGRVPTPRDATVEAMIPSTFRLCPNCHAPNTKAYASPQSECHKCRITFTWADASIYEQQAEEVVEKQAQDGASPVKRKNEEYASTDEPTSRQATSSTPTTPSSSGAVPVREREEEGGTSAVFNATVKPSLQQKGNHEASETDRFLQNLTASAAPDNKRRRNPKMRPRRTRSPSPLPLPAEYVPLQPERFPVEDMPAAYAAMAGHDSRADERSKAPQRAYQRQLAEANL